MTSSDSYHHGDLRAALVREASTVLERDGATAISFRALARELNVSHAAPAHHFGSRNELLAELAADGFTRLADVLEQALDTNAPQRWVTVSAGAYVRFALANPERYRLMFTSRLTQGDCPPRLDAESTRAYLALLRAVHQRKPTDDRTTYRVAAPELRAWSVVHGGVMLWLDGQFRDALSADEFVELMDEVAGTAATHGPA